jgi:non-homologous end joining protein Ku
MATSTWYYDSQEVEAARSSRAIDPDAFVNFFERDPHYVDKTYLLIPNGSEASYDLMRRALHKKGTAVIGQVTLRSWERTVIVHYKRDALVATTLRALR